MHIEDLLRRPQASAYEQNMRRWLNSRERQFFAAKGKNDDVEITIMDVIGSSWFFEGATARSVKRILDENKDAKSVRVLIDSPGGDVFEGVSIFNLLKKCSAHVTIEVIGEASSAASVISMAGDRVIMHQGTMMMVHRASSGTWGFASDLRGVADALDKITESITDIYETRTGKPRAEIDALVTAETWMTPKEAVALGFADEVGAAKAKSKPAPDNRSPRAEREAQQRTTTPRAGLAGFLNLSAKTTADLCK